MKNRRFAFTIIELMITISIIALLIAAASIGIAKTEESGRDTQRISDVLSIAEAIDQSAATQRGVYPTGSGNVMYADQITSGQLDLSLFKNNQIPVDPSYANYTPAQRLAACGITFVCGYIYNNRTTGGGSLANDGWNTNNDQYEYVLEVGLEGDRFNDDQSLVAGPSGTVQGRTEYLFLGKFCGTGRTTNSCSIP